MPATALEQLGVTEEEYVHYVAQNVDGRRLLHACLTLLVYDYILTFRREIVDVWQREPRFSVAIVLFGLNRYCPMIIYAVRTWVFCQNVLSQQICSTMLAFTGWSAVLSFAIVEVVLMLRVWALYDKSKRVGALLGTLFAVALASSFALRKIHPQDLHLAPIQPESLTQCHRSTSEEYFWLYLIGIVVETTIFILLIVKARAYSLRTAGAPLISALLAHGTVYYAVVLATLILTTISTFSPVIYQPIADSNLIVAITSISCNRLILSLRGLYFKRGALATTVPMTSETKMLDDINMNDLPVNERPFSFGKGGKARAPRHQHQLSTYTEDELEGGISISRVGKHPSTGMYFYGLSGYGYTPSFVYEARPSAPPPSTELPDRRVFPKLRSLSSRVRNKTSRRAGRLDLSPKNEQDNITKSPHFLRIPSWLHPSRWLRRKVKHAVSEAGAPVIPPINVGDRLFLETLVRHAADNSFDRSRTSTLPLLRRTSDTPTFDSFRGTSLPPGIVAEVEHSSATSHSYQPRHIIDMRLLHSVTPTVERSPSRSNNDLILLRSPHPPSSYVPVPAGAGLFRSRLSTQSGYSTATSCYDPHDFQISSFSESVLSGTTSPLFYQPSRNTTPISPASPVLGAQVIRRKSNRISSQSVIPAQANSRAGSLTVSIRTEDGQEDLEFPPPPRWSGCWFSERSNNQKPRPSTTEGDQSEDDYDDDIDDDIAATIAELARVSEVSLESLTESVPESGSTSPLPIPHMRTFGPHATSFLSLKAHCRSQPSVQDSKPVAETGVSSFEDYDGGHEEMESVCSAFADVSLSNAATFEGHDPISDADSFQDPSFMRLHPHAI